MRHFVILLACTCLASSCTPIFPLPAPTPYTDYQTKTRLALPVSGEWYVYWGGPRKAQNYHVTSSHQRFAYDFVRVRVGEPLKKDPLRAGQSYEGDLKLTSSHYAFGQPVYAPADGAVVDVRDGMDDNIPRKFKKTKKAGKIFGNYIIIDHGLSEFSVLGHLRKGSVAVESGEIVKRGQFLGECGNSGNSTDPHLHYHLQDGPKIKQARGLPAYFTDYYADGKLTEYGIPVKGMRVSSGQDAYFFK